MNVAGSKKSSLGDTQDDIMGSGGKEKPSNTLAPSSICKCSGGAGVEDVELKENVLKSWKNTIYEKR